MVYYFSATGNSRHVAKRIGAAFGEQVMSVLDVNNEEIFIDSGERFVLVTPNYCGGMPYPVADFLRSGRLKLHPETECILVITYGNNTGASYSVASKYLKKSAGRGFDAMYSVLMPDTWTPVFDLTNEEEVAEINRKADEQLDAVIEKMKANSKGDFVNDKLGKFSELIYPAFYKSLSKTKHLKVEDSCIGCGQCAANCPMQAIEMKNGRPAWIKKNCAMCLGCLHRCPQFAIQYGTKTKDHGQYLHPDEK